MEYKINQNGNTLLESVYNNRNLTDEYIDSLLYSETWEDPINYKNISKGYGLLMNTIKKGGDIGIVVDPDVDGYTASALMLMFIYDDLKYDNVGYIIKQKKVKSHGITQEIIDKVKEHKFDLLIFPDAASNDFKFQKNIKDLGCDILITDHHEFDLSQKPSAVIINNQDGIVENKHLSGCGVTYKFCYYCAEKENIDLGYKYLDLVALSLISDMCDMTSLENRFLFNLGNKKENIENKLLKEFVKDLKIKNKVSIENYGFGVAPLINSTIRLGSYEQKEDLMESLLNSVENVEYKYRGKTLEQSIQASILRIGRNLKASQKRQLNKLIEKGIDILNDENDKVIIIKSNDIKPELKGVLCNRLSSEYKKPVCVLSGDEILTGSARGMNNIDFKSICVASNCCLYAEGHRNSFGLSTQAKDIHKFISFINKELLGVEFDNAVEIDYVYEGGVPLQDILDLSTDIEDLWDGRIIKRPKILIKNIRVNSKDIKYRVRGDNGMTFKIDNVVYRRDFASRVFYEDFICSDENLDNDKDIMVDMICEIKVNERGFSYVNICDCESRIIQ